MSGNYLYAFVGSVCYSLAMTNNTLAQQSGTQNNWTKSTQSIGSDWLHQIGTTAPSGGPSLYNFCNNVGGSATDDNFKFIMSHLSNYPIQQWAMDAVTGLQSFLAAHYNDDSIKDAASAYSSTLGQESSIIQAQSSQDTSIGDSVAKAELSTMQNTTSSGQPNVDAGNNVIGVVTSGANSQGSISV